MKTAAHHIEGKKCLIEIHNYKTGKSDFVMGKILNIVSATDREYRINVETEDGIKLNECAPECITKYYYIAARSAWDTVQIGPFNTIEEAEKECLKSEYKFDLIKEA